MEFNIVKNAMKFLAHIYQNCDSMFKVENLELKSLQMSLNQKQQSCLYLQRMGYISVSHNLELETDKITCSISIEGINAAEEYFVNKKH